MKTVFENLEPQAVWNNFALLCSIPRPSKYEGAVIEHLFEMGRRLDLSPKRDEVGNLLLSKPAYQGYENRKKIVLQGHVDMVPQKNSDTLHDFTKDPIQPRIVDGWVSATGTSLGADNGIGVAAIMAVLQAKNLQHGPLEALFTIDEETGMGGAFGLSESFLTAFSNMVMALS